jgi:hypothetical protein
VKWVSISQGLPLLCLRAPDEAKNRQALWNRIDSTGQVEGLKERSRMEGGPSTSPLPAGVRDALKYTDKPGMPPFNSTAMPPLLAEECDVGHIDARNTPETPHF